MPFQLTKVKAIIASIVGVITIAGSCFAVYNHFAKQEDLEELKSSHVEFKEDAKTTFVEVDKFDKEVFAVNKNVQQTNYEFWIYKNKQDLDKLYDQLRDTNDPVEKQQIQDQIDSKKRDIERYEDKLDALKE